MFKNRTFLKNISNTKIDFDNNLSIKDSITLDHCNNFELIINSKVNKLIFIKCNNIKLSCIATISGIDIEKCYNFNLDSKSPHDLKIISCFKSTINISNYLELINKFYIENEYSEINFQL